MERMRIVSIALNWECFMHCISSVRRHAPSFVAALSFLAGATAAYGADTYIGGVLQIPVLGIGSATYSNVAINVGNIISGPTGSVANGTVDSYDPGTNELTVQSVDAGGTTYHNVVVTVAGLVSIGGVTGADSYDGANLSISLVQFAGSVYEGVVVTEALNNVVSVAGGMPTLGPDTYNLLNNELAIPAVQVGNHVYTNVLVTAGKLLAVGGIHSTTHESVLYAFGGAGSGGTDGVHPGGLTLGSDGYFYGTTSSGGANNLGAVFRLTLAGVETVLYSFAGGAGDGAVPDAGLIEASNGEFYGTTNVGGNAYGTVFSITSGGSESMLYAFAGPNGDGANPHASLIQGSDGNFYGTTYGGGGATHSGTIFKVTPEGAETVLYTFGAGGVAANGSNPPAGLIEDADGNLYGVTAQGGADNFGTVFKLTSEGAQTVLHSFTGPNGDGQGPQGGLVQGSDGNFYGTTSNGGTIASGDPNGNGTVYKITPAGVETVLYSFAGSNGDPSQPDAGGDGQEPNANLVKGSDGNFYGITSAGGAFGEGTVYKITPAGVEAVLYSFKALNGDGAGPTSLIQGSDGNLYGSTNGGGTNGNGTIFKITL